ncbi:hypothetical protein ABE48_19130 [Bacillus thuringiensis]|nr:MULTISPECIES: hypothetical protein [Bacillus cereus group]MBG9533245.1 hypothetical protein [Bacillus thuringiensis]MCH5458251.1 hypothetical protein [Bacillus cereus]SME71477.1 hypothetical protein BACERE00198_03162 [Bacillus cereus]
MNCKKNIEMESNEYMSNQHSFTITKSNNATEKAGINYLQSKDERFINPDKETRKKILEKFNIPKKFHRTFDLIYVENGKMENGQVNIDDLLDITLIELKTTQKELPNNPLGFFFGATENEFELASLLGNQYKFCFVCLHSNCPSYKVLTLAELDEIIQRKRIQYQINL